MRHKDTKAVTITIPETLYKAVEQLASRDHCGNVSAVIRAALYKEAGVSSSLELKDDASAKIQDAEQRTIKYSSKKRRKKS